MASPVRVLVVDDSPVFALAVRSILEDDPEITVVAVASNGREAVKLTESLAPDVITMDVMMPVMDGLEAIERIMVAFPTPILVVSSDPRAETGELHFEALRRGALDALPKPTAWPLPKAEATAIREHLKLLARVTVVRHVGGRARPKLESTIAPAPAPEPPPPRRQTSDAIRIVGVVASTGGPAALAALLSTLPVGFDAPIVVVQHIARGFARSLAEWLDGQCDLHVRLARDGDLLQVGTALVAPDEHHLAVTPDGVVKLDSSEPVGGHRPSGTRLLLSLAEGFRHDAIGVVLTGMGDDGVAGLRAIRDMGGATIAEAEGSCLIYGMPKAAWETGAAERRLLLHQIPGALARLVGCRRGDGGRRQGGTS